MRVTQSMMSAQIQRELQAALAAIAREQEHISSGRRILAPADDPVGAARAVAIRSRQAAAAQFTSNVATAQSTLGAADTALAAIAEVVTQGIEAAVQGASDSNDALARQSIGASVDQLLETLVTLGNGRTGTGTFLFGGQESRTAPYTVTRNVAGRITAVVPNPRGIDGTTQAGVGEGVSVSTRVSGTAVFGAATDDTYAFDVLIHLRDSLNGQPTLTFQPDVTGPGAANAQAFTGIAAADLQITGPSGSATVGATTAADDTLSYSGNATSAIAVAAQINLVGATTGVTATATKAVVTYAAGSFASDVDLDGTAGKTLVINGVAILGAVSGSSAAERRDALVGLVNAQSGASGVTASAVPGGGDGFALIASDGRNISIETDGTIAPTSANAVLFGFTAGLTGTGAATRVVARGRVALTAGTAITVTPAAGSLLTEQMVGAGASEIRAALGNMHGVLDRVVIPSTLVGTRLAWIARIAERSSAESIGLASDLSRVEDLDLAKAATDLQLLQTFYEAALASGARLVQLTLLNFLR